MKILISNDDGLYGAGLEPLVKVMKKLGEVFVVVPDSQMSASSHSITIHKPIRLIFQKKNFYTVTGTPSDCVRFGILEILKGKVDIVVSGINDGPNMGEDCIYSGTVAAAREGAILGFRSFAVSLVGNGKGNFNIAAEYAYKIIKEVMKSKIPEYTFLNINVPNVDEIKGVAVTKMGKRIYDDEIEERTDPRGYKYYWIAGKQMSGYPIKNTDILAVEKKYVSVTPLKVDQTDLSYLKKLKNILPERAVIGR
ncbi:MAG: 5'/3'-nucleotidase SurE [Elusimicrobiota bacterium]